MVKLPEDLVLLTLYEYLPLASHQHGLREQRSNVKVLTQPFRRIQT